MLTILLIIFSLSLIVFFHEFGHFIFGKFFKVRVEEFGFGYPPRIFCLTKINKKYKFFFFNKIPRENLETIYSFNLIPFGGFNKFAGEEAGKIEKSDYFYAKPWWQRTIIALGGPLMNIFLAFILFTFISLFGFYQEVTPDLYQKNVLIKDVGIRIVSIVKNSPAEKAGLKVNDLIISIDGKKFSEIEEIQNYIKNKLNEAVKFQIKRKNKILIISVKPKSFKEVFNEEREGAAIGIVLGKIGRIYYPMHLAILNGFKTTFITLINIFLAFIFFLKEIILHQKLIADVVGVVGLASISKEAAQVGIIYLMQFTGFISLLVVLTQILPFPALDGGRIIFFLIEGIRGKPVDPKIENTINSLGFALLLILMFYITYRDIIRLIKSP
jgi:regulator of sigma E protease